MRIFFLYFFFIFLSQSISALKIEGVVKDARTGEFLTGAHVYLEGSEKDGTTAGLNGDFVLNGVNPGKYKLKCSFISYQTYEKEISLTQNSREKIYINLIETGQELKDIVVVAAAGNSDQGVRNIERASSVVMNITSAKSIEISPDLSVAQVLGRMSGVVLERNSSGEGQYAVLRGMDKRYNTTLVNGVKIASPDNKQRYVPLDIFPSDLLDRLEINKTQTADKEGDATGGSVNMVMRDAPSSFELRVNASTGYNLQYLERDFLGYNYKETNKITPYELYGKDYSAKIEDFGSKLKPLSFEQPKPNIVAGLSVGNRFLNRKLGLILAASYQQMNKGSQGIFYGDYMNQTASAVIVDDYEQRTNDERQIQAGVHAKMDYRFNDSHKISWFNTFISSENPSVRFKNGIDLSLNYNPPANSNISFEFRQRLTNQQILASVLQGEHKMKSSLDLKWSLVYSDAALQRPDQTYVELDNTRVNNVDDIFVDVDGNTHRWEHNRDRDVTAYVHATYPLKNIAGGNLLLQGGAMFRTKERNNFWIEYTFKPLNLSQRMGADFKDIYDIGSISWYVGNPKGSLGPLDYDASELTASGYLQGRYNIGKLEIIAGLRTEYTDQGYYMLMKSLVYSQEGGQKYVDFLPNIHLKYAPVSTQNWRFSYYKSLNRPGFFEIIPYMTVNEDYTEYGNPDLERAKIQNIDFRWELFPQPNEQLMIGTFYKHIQSPIEFAYFSKNDRQFGYGPRNLGNANNLGVEIDVIRYFREFGVKANYTYTYSAIKTPKVYYTQNSNNYTEKKFQDQVRPLVGQAAHVANLSLLYKNTKRGIDAQLSGAYTGEKIVIASHFLNSDYWQKPNLQLDASAEITIAKGLKLFFKATNLLNTPVIEFIKTHNPENDGFPEQSATSGETLIRKMYFNRNVLAGIRFKM
jgi:hypothetical protein